MNKPFKEFFVGDGKSLRRGNEMTDEKMDEVVENQHIEDTHQADESKRVIGKIIKLSPEGWGFITSKEVPFTRIFFHWTSLKQNTKKFLDLKVGMTVSFIPIEIDEKGTRAIKIQVVEVTNESNTK